MGLGKKLPNFLTQHGIMRAVANAGEGTPRNKGDFTNLRTEAAWKLRCRLDPTFCPDPHVPAIVQPAFHIPPGPFWPRLREDLKALTYDLAGKRTRLLPKDEWSATGIPKVTVCKRKR